MNKFSEFELKYEVDKIRVANTQIWPFLRIYIALQYLLKKEQIKLSKKNIFKLLGSFFRGIHYFFSNDFEFLAFSDTDRRVLIEGKYYDRLVDFLAQEKKVLIIETPLFSHYSKDKTYSRHLASRLPLLLMEHVVSLFLKKPKIEREDILINILHETSVNIDYHKIIKYIKAQEIIMRFILRHKKIKGVFVVVSYTKAGIIKACQENAIPVVELQHGIINNSHPAYNIPLRLESQFFPDYLLTYGDFEKQVFENDNYFIDKNRVISIGNSIVEYYRKYDRQNSILWPYKEKYLFLVAITGQVAFDSKLIPFIIDAALINRDILYIYIPRGTNYILANNLQTPQNLISIEEQINTYEIIANCDFHATVTSTCSIEALCMGIPNCFINIDNWSKNYYKHLESKKYNYFIDTPAELVNVIFSIKKVPKQLVYEHYDFFIKSNYEKNMKAFLNSKFE